jgi:cell wall-associated NlpC family hydrolase
MRTFLLLLLSFFIISTAFAQATQKSKTSVAPKKKVVATKKYSTTARTSAKKKSVKKTVPPVAIKTDSASNPAVDNLLTILTKELGKPYRLGSNGPTGFDCSGLIKFAFSFIGIALPRTAADIGQIGQKITLNDLHPGDLLFFSGRNPSRNSIGHVGCVYRVDSGKVYMIHSDDVGVNILDINNSEYYKKRFIYAKRVVAPDTCKTSPSCKSKG